MSLLLAGLLISGAAAAAPEESLSFDIRCLILAGDLLQSADESSRAAATGAAAFYLGRVDLRANGADLSERMVEEAVMMQTQDRQEMLAACGRFMEERGRAMQEMGERIRRVEESQSND